MVIGWPATVTLVILDKFLMHLLTVFQCLLIDITALP